jgi:hypothetical protein
MAQRKIIYYDFDLDKKPSDRWAPIFEKFSSDMTTLCKHINRMFKEFETIIPVIKAIFDLVPPTKIMFYEEIKYIAGIMKLEIFQVVLLQLIYETSAACTTAIFEVGGEEYFFRTMDWPMTFLKDITIGLNVKKNNQIISKVIGWLGCVGFYTAETDTYIVSINYRRTVDLSIGNVVVNAYRTLDMNWPISYLVRHIIEKQLERSSAIKLYEMAQLISPTYITICAIHQSKIIKAESVIITRDWNKLVSTRTQNLVQTNCDDNRETPDILWSIDRRNLFNDIMKELNEHKITSKKIILKSLLRAPMINHDTIYVYFSTGPKSIAFV